MLAKRSPGCRGLSSKIETQAAVKKAKAPVSLDPGLSQVADLDRGVNVRACFVEYLAAASCQWTLGRQRKGRQLSPAAKLSAFRFVSQGREGTGQRYRDLSTWSIAAFTVRSPALTRASFRQRLFACALSRLEGVCGEGAICHCCEWAYGARASGNDFDPPHRAPQFRKDLGD
jgi:hypothetical protein